MSLRRPRLGTAVTGLLVVVAACSPGTGVRPDPGSATTSTLPPTTSTTTTTPPSRYGGTVVVGVGDAGSPRTLNPFLDGPDAAVLDLIGPAIFARGWIAHPVTGLPVADVLESVPSLGNGLVVDNGNGTMEVTAVVQGGAHWADGMPISGDDLAFTIAVATDPDLPIRGDLADLYGLILPGSVRPSPKSVTFTMEATTAYERLFAVIIPRHGVEGSDFAADWNDEAWIEAGPFVVGEFVAGQLLSLERNEEYWKTAEDGGALPYLDRVIFRFYESAADPDPRLLDGFNSGDIDLVTLASAQDTAEPYLALEDAEVTTAPGPIWTFLNFQFGPGNRNAISQNRHLEYRRAVAHAIDREALALERGTAPVSSVLSRFGLASGEGPWDQYAYNLDAVESELFALSQLIDLDPFAGDGLDLSLTVPGNSAAEIAIAGQVVTMLRDAGFDAELQLEDSAVFFGPTFDNGAWDVGSWGLSSAPGASNAAAFFTIFDPDGLPFVGSNFFRWGTIDSTVTGEAVDRYRDLVDELQGLIDPAEASILMALAEEILADQVVFIPLVVRDDVGVAWWASRVEGVTLNPYGGIAWNVASWRRIG